MSQRLYTADATADGPRTGRTRSSDGRLDVTLSRPAAMGGDDGPGTNPEQLFAAGYAACFHSALKRVAKEQGLDIEPSEISAKVTLGLGDDKAFGLAVTLLGALPTLDPSQGDELMQAAHQVCPYSRATRGNIEVTLELAPAPGA